MNTQEVITAFIVFLATLFLVLKWTGIRLFKLKPNRKPDVKTSRLLQKTPPAKNKKE